MIIREITRFAPSPTGNLHLGGFKTALINYLLARQTNGIFHLRFEDTDTDRNISNSPFAIINDLNWAGIGFDTISFQSLNLLSYKNYALKLIEMDKAYWCFCPKSSSLLQSYSNSNLHSNSSESPLTKMINVMESKNKEEIHELKCHASISSTDAQRRILNGEMAAIRLKSRNISYKSEFNDLVYGMIKGEPYLNDIVLMKSDGYPSFHFANCIDDHEQEITTVMRGHVSIYDFHFHSCNFEFLL